MNLRREIRGVLRSVRYDLFRRGAEPEHPTHRGIVLLGLSLLVLAVAAGSYFTVLGVAKAVRGDTAVGAAAGRAGTEIQGGTADGGPAGSEPRRVTSTPRRLPTRSPVAQPSVSAQPEAPRPTPTRSTAGPSPTPEGSPTPSPTASSSPSPTPSATPTATVAPTPTSTHH